MFFIPAKNLQKWYLFSKKYTQINVVHLTTDFSLSYIVLTAAEVSICCLEFFIHISFYHVPKKRKHMTTCIKQVEDLQELFPLTKMLSLYLLVFFSLSQFMRNRYISQHWGEGFRYMSCNSFNCNLVWQRLSIKGGKRQLITGSMTLNL